MRFAILGVAVALAAMSRSAVAQDVVAPAAAPTPAVASGAAGKIEKGRELFANYACGGCHALAEAGAAGHVGPPLDGDSNLTEGFVVDRVTNGQGVMPAFGGQLSQEDIAAIAAYVTQAKAK